MKCDDGKTEIVNQACLTPTLLREISEDDLKSIKLRSDPQSVDFDIDMISLYIRADLLPKVCLSCIPLGASYPRVKTVPGWIIISDGGGITMRV